MCYLRIFLGTLLLAGTLSADQIYTWITPPTVPTIDPEDVRFYAGVIQIDAAYASPTIYYENTTFNIDVAAWGIPAPGFEDLFVLTIAPDPPSIPEPVLWPFAGGAISGFALFKRAKARP